MGSPLLVLALPLVSFLAIALIRPLRRRGTAAGWTGIVAMGFALVAALQTWLGGIRGTMVIPWLPGDGGAMATVGLLVDELSVPMLVLVTLVSFLVQLYSLAYLHDEPRPSLGRYYAYHSLFAFSMLGLVLAPSYIQMFVFWELVGLCSYLLIGFWYTRPSAAAAAVKAFWTTKLGDLGFVAGIVMLWSATGTFQFDALFEMAQGGSLPVEGLAIIMFLIYLGAVGKSAQFPLHVWLPDAMEGPTPVSALIHAATMVTAGVFLVARSEPLFALVPDVLMLIARVGALTALLAATMACVERDIKRVLAYSTVSQLGYMMAAAGAGAAAAGFFHLLTHGVFKALLFLGAGAVIHAVGTNDIFRMGGLRRAMPQTTLIFVIGTLALAGVWPLAGFFSKEAVLEGVWAGGSGMQFAVLALTAFLTAFYMFRVVIITFFGRPRTGADVGYDAHAHGAHPAHVAAHGLPHDAPWLMRGPLWLLAFLTVAIGLHFAAGAGGGEHHPPAWLTALSLALALGGIALAWAMYGAGWISPAAVAAALAPIDLLARRRYFLDAIYRGIYRGLLLGFARLIGALDRYFVDGLLNVASAWSLRAGDALRRIQSGQAQDYVYGVTFGVLLLLVLAQWWRSP